jgi:hypothetical protein
MLSPESKGNAKSTTTDNKNMLTINFCGIPKKMYQKFKIDIELNNSYNI